MAVIIISVWDADQSTVQKLSYEAAQDTYMTGKWPLKRYVWAFRNYQKRVLLSTF